MKNLLLFLLRATGISLLFVPLLPQFQQIYRFLLTIITTTGYPATETMNVLPYDGSNNLYTFLILILAIPGMTIKRRLIGVATGIIMFLSADFFMEAVWIPYLKTPQPSLANMAVSYGWLVVAHYLLPFLLWLALAFDQIERLLMDSKESLGI